MVAAPNVWVETCEVNLVRRTIYLPMYTESQTVDSFDLVTLDNVFSSRWILAEFGKAGEIITKEPNFDYRLVGFLVKFSPSSDLVGCAMRVSTRAV